MHLPNPQEIVSQCFKLQKEGAQEHFLTAARGLKAPLNDLLQSPISAKIALLGYNDGRHFYHHEARGYIPTPPEMGPSLTVWKQDSLLPIWQDGIRISPKYFSFFLDIVLPPFHPNHRQKWRPHELLHTQSKFYYQNEMTRFQFYVGARISELLPVVHWYHLDEILRPRCQKHQGKTLYTTYCPDCEQLVSPFWEHEISDQLLAIAHHKAIDSIDHFQQEIDSIKEELRSGAPVTTCWGKLNASSDSIGYLHSHWNRIQSFGQRYYIENFLTPGVDYFSDLEELLEHNIALFQFLTLENPKINQQQKQQYLRRRIQDVASRCCQVLNWGDDHCFLWGQKQLSTLREHCQTLQNTLIDEVIIEEEIDRIIEKFIERDQFASVTTRPLLFDSIKNQDVDSIQEGIQSAFPESWEIFPLNKNQLIEFINSQIFQLPKSLHQRLPKWLSMQDDDAKASYYKLEAFVRQGPHRDEYFDLFQIVPSPDELQCGSIRPNLTMDTGRFPTDTLQSYLGWEETEDNILICRNYVCGELAVFPLDSEFEAVLQDPQNADQKMLCESIAAGLFVFQPHNS